MLKSCFSIQKNEKYKTFTIIIEFSNTHGIMEKLMMERKEEGNEWNRR